MIKKGNDRCEAGGLPWEVWNLNMKENGSAPESMVLFVEVPMLVNQIQKKEKIPTLKLKKTAKVDRLKAKFLICKSRDQK